MGTRVSILLEAYTKTWNLCLGILLIFAVVAALALFFRFQRLEFELSSRRVFWACLIPGFLLLAVCLTLIDKPRFPVSSEMADWFFMFSAFLGIPVAVPLFAGAAWASAHYRHRVPVKASSLLLVLVGMFALGCAASNIHDVIWCASVTDIYAKHQAAGYDLDFFVAFGKPFGISREVLADYATLGPCAIVMVIGELAAAAACFRRLARLGDSAAIR